MFNELSCYIINKPINMNVFLSYIKKNYLLFIFHELINYKIINSFI